MNALTPIDRTAVERMDEDDLLHASREQRERWAIALRYAGEHELANELTPAEDV